MIATAALGALFIYSGALGLIREFLSRPEEVKYPKAPSWVRGLIALYGMIFIAIGLSALFSLGGRQPWNTEAYFVLAALVTAFHNTTLLYDMLRQGYGARVHSRIEQIKQIASCPPEERQVRAAATKILFEEGYTIGDPQYGDIPIDRNSHPSV